LRVLDAGSIGYADFRVKVQYISEGNVQGNGRVSLLLMDYIQCRRLKILGHVQLVPTGAKPALIEQLALPHHG